MCHRPSGLPGRRAAAALLPGAALLSGIYIYIYMYTRIRMCMYIYIYTHICTQALRRSARPGRTRGRSSCRWRTAEGIYLFILYYIYTHIIRTIMIMIMIIIHMCIHIYTYILYVYIDVIGASAPASASAAAASAASWTRAAPSCS